MNMFYSMLKGTRNSSTNMFLPMKRLVPTFILLVFSCTSINKVVEADLYNKWNIEFPSVTLIESNNTVVMDYGISSDELTSANIRKNIFTKNCSGPDLSDYSDGIRENTVDTNTGAHIFQIDPMQLASNEDVFEANYDNQTASMKFCLRYSLWSGEYDDDGGDAIEINYQYTILTIDLVLGGTFGFAGLRVNGPDDDDDKAVGGFMAKDVNEIPRVEVYLCDPYTHQKTSAPVGGYGAGDVLSMCVEATQALIDDGMYLRGVENFKWTRQYLLNGVPTTAIQWAIKDGIPDPLSQYYCPMNALFCTFTTMLIADFFTLPGYVSGEGNAGVGFVRSRNRPHRGLGHERPTELRSLQEDAQEQASNLMVLVPLRGLDVVLPYDESPAIRDVRNTSLWLAAAVLICSFCLGAYFWWKIWHRRSSSIIETLNILKWRD